jgi:AcrR family transcriptional regulator
MPYRTSPQTAERKAAMRARILAAARRLFVAQGYDATTIQAIVQEAGTSIGNCYFYFPNKEALLLAVAAEIMDEVSRAMDAAMARVPPGPGRAAAALYAGATTILAQPDVARVALAEAAHPALRPLAVERFTERIRQFFAANPALLGDLDPALVVPAWQGTLFHVLEVALAGRAPVDGPALGRFLARWNLQALGLPPEAVDAALAVLDTLDLPAPGEVPHGSDPDCRRR